MAGQAVIVLIPYFNRVIKRISGQTDRCEPTVQSRYSILTISLLLVIRDVNFWEFYFSIREFQISRRTLVEYSKRNNVTRHSRHSPWKSPRSCSPPLPLTHWELITVESRLLGLLAQSSRPVTCWQVDVRDKFHLFVMAGLQLQHLHHMLCLQMIF